MTHDLFKSVLDDLGAKVTQVIITELHSEPPGSPGTFYAEIELVHGAGTHRISTRPSDAIALAVRYAESVPIYASESVMDEAGVIFEQDEEEEQIEAFREFLDDVRPEDFARGPE